MTRADSELDAPNPDASARDPGERSRAQDGAFDHRCRTRVVYGPGTSDRTGALFLSADGSVRFFSKKTSTRVLEMLSTRDGRENAQIENH